MSKYTTEVRFICEHLYGLDESKGSSDVDEIISNSWDKIFTTKCTFFDEEYRKPLCCKILKHYYTREIGAETFGLWKLWMNTKLEEIMPYYNQLYKSELIKFDPLSDVNVTTISNKIDKAEETTTENNNNTTTIENETKNTGKNYNLYSDTPQGALTGVENENYLTNARKITDNNTETGNSSSSSNTNNNGQRINDVISDYSETIKGKRNGESCASMLMKFRESMLNIDMQVIEEFNELFYGLW